MRQLYGTILSNITKTQNEAARLITGLTRSVSLEKMYKECGLVTLSQRRQQNELSFMHNVNTGMVSSYIQNLIILLVKFQITL